jgi:hypothetical protein
MPVVTFRYLSVSALPPVWVRVRDRGLVRHLLRWLPELHAGEAEAVDR